MVIKKEIDCGSLYIQETENKLYVDFNPKGANGLIPIAEITGNIDHTLLTAFDLDGNTRELIYPIEASKKRAM